MRAYWRTSPAQRWRQEANSEVAYTAAVAYLRREVGAAGFTPAQIETEVEARSPEIEVILEDEYARRGGVVATTVWP